MVLRASSCLRRIAQGRRSAIVQFGRFLDNEDVKLEALVEHWGKRTAGAVNGRHVLAIQDTSEIALRTTPARRRELGDVGKGHGHGFLLHAMLALDAESGHLLGLTGGRIWNREERVTVAHRDRALEDKESERWLTTGERAKTVLATAASVTVVADRESDIYAEWASLPGPNFHLLTRSMQDRRLVGGGSLYGTGAGFAIADTAEIDLRGHEAQVPTRRARLSLRFGRVTLARPGHLPRSIPAGVALTLVEVVELEPPPGHDPVHWHLLTTHSVHDAAAAWRIVGWYKQRWTIENDQAWRLSRISGGVFGLREWRWQPAPRRRRRADGLQGGDLGRVGVHQLGAAAAGLHHAAA